MKHRNKIIIIVGAFLPVLIVSCSVNEVNPKFDNNNTQSQSGDDASDPSSSSDGTVKDSFVSDVFNDVSFQDHESIVLDGSEFSDASIVDSSTSDSGIIDVSTFDANVSDSSTTCPSLLPPSCQSGTFINMNCTNVCAGDYYGPNECGHCDQCGGGLIEGPGDGTNACYCLPTGALDAPNSGCPQDGKIHYYENGTWE